MKIQAVKCPECGAKISEDAVRANRTVVCEYCGTLVALTPEMAQQPIMPELRRPPHRLRRPGRPPPVLMLVNSLVRKGVIDDSKFRETVKKKIKAGVPRLTAIRRTMGDMIRNGQIDKNKMLKALDDLVAEKKIPRRAAQNVKRLLRE